MPGFFDLFKDPKTDFERYQEEAAAGKLGGNYGGPGSPEAMEPAPGGNYQEAGNMPASEGIPVSEGAPMPERNDNLIQVSRCQESRSLEMTINSGGETKKISLTSKEMDLINEDRLDEAKAALRDRAGMTDEQAEQFIRLAKNQFLKPFMSGEFLSRSGLLNGREMSMIMGDQPLEAIKSMAKREIKETAEREITRTVQREIRRRLF